MMWHVRMVSLNHSLGYCEYGAFGEPIMHCGRERGRLTGALELVWRVPHATFTHACPVGGVVLTAGSR